MGDMIKDCKVRTAVKKTSDVSHKKKEGVIVKWNEVDAYSHNSG